jgi:hypothetical protein
MTGDPQKGLSTEQGQHNISPDFFSDMTTAGPALPLDTNTMGTDVPHMPPQQPGPYGRPHIAEALASAPGPLPAKLAYLWRKDPAYKVLFIAIAAILLCSIVGATMLFATFSQSVQPQQSDSAASGPNAVAFTPGGKGQQPQSTPVLSQTTVAVATPTPLPSPTAVASSSSTPATNENGPLTVQITNLPDTVNNHTTVPVTVKASKTDTTVTLTVFYFGAQPVTFRAGPQSVDANGNTTFYWNIDEGGFGSSFKKHITAHVVATVQEQNGNTANSNVITVQVKMQ